MQALGGKEQDVRGYGVSGTMDLKQMVERMLVFHRNSPDTNTWHTPLSTSHPAITA
jgi:hypothetical protein